MLYEKYDQSLRPLVWEVLDTFKLDRRRNREQLDEIFAVLDSAKRMSDGEAVAPTFTSAPCGTGKTVTLMVVAEVLRRLDDSLKVVVVLPNTTLLRQMKDDMEGVPFKEVAGCDKLKKGAQPFKQGLTLTTHQVLAAHAGGKVGSRSPEEVNAVAA